MSNNNNKSDGKNQKQYKYQYASAPYNFIPFPDKVVYRHKAIKGKKSNEAPEDLKENTAAENKNEEEKINELPHHNVFKSDLKTGYIEYSIDVETPLFIGDGKGEFFKVNNQYTIPGSTIRGKIRSNAEILSYAYPEFVEGKRLWYRGAFPGDVLKDLYKEKLLPEEDSKITDKVKAGYLTNDNGQYRITPAKEDIKHETFKQIHEKDLVMQTKYIDRSERFINLMYSLRCEDVKTSFEKDSWNKFENLKDKKGLLKRKIKTLKEEKKSAENKAAIDTKINSINSEISELDEDIIDILINNEVKNYEPYFCSISYNVSKSNQIKITNVKRFNYDKNSGVLFNSTKMEKSKKQNHYIIYSPNFEAGSIIIDRDLINSFQTSVQYRAKIVDKFHLPQTGETMPVFYILNDDKKLDAFGFTPYLKIAYDKSVNEGINTKKEHESNLLDYVQGIFGFTNFKYKEDGKDVKRDYKGRVSFTNAIMTESQPIVRKKELETYYKSLMNPKISSFQLYVEQDNVNDKKDLNTYQGEFKLRGQKFYWLRDDYNRRDDCEAALQEYKNKKKERQRKDIEGQFAKLKPIEGSKFKGRIYFENLSDDELGLLLTAIKPFKDAKDNLGQGKPYGFGKVSFNILKIKEINSKERFKSLNIKFDDYSSLKDKIKSYQDEFKKAMEQKDIKFDYIENNRLNTFYLSKSEEKNIDEDEFNYMNLNLFKNREKLKTMIEYIKENEVDISSLVLKFNKR